MSTHTYTYMRDTRSFSETCTPTYTHTYVCMYTHTHVVTHSNTYAYAHTYTRAYIPTYANTCTHTDMFANTNTYTYEYTHTILILTIRALRDRVPLRLIPYIPRIHTNTYIRLTTPVRGHTLTDNMAEKVQDTSLQNLTVLAKLNRVAEAQELNTTSVQTLVKMFSEDPAELKFLFHKQGLKAGTESWHDMTTMLMRPPGGAARSRIYFLLARARRLLYRRARSNRGGHTGEGGEVECHSYSLPAGWYYATRCDITPDEAAIH